MPRVRLRNSMSTTKTNPVLSAASKVKRIKNLETKEYIQCRTSKFVVLKLKNQIDQKTNFESLLGLNDLKTTYGSREKEQ